MTSKYDDLLAKENASILLLYKVCEEKNSKSVVLLCKFVYNIFI